MNWPIPAVANIFRIEGTIREIGKEEKKLDGGAREGWCPVEQGNRNPFIDQPELVERVGDF